MAGFLHQANGRQSHQNNHNDKHAEALLFAALYDADMTIEPVQESSPDSAQSLGETEHLNSAFELFNDLSEQLTGSYQLLEERVANLTIELDAVSEQRIEELKQKEQLANRLENLISFLPGGVVVLDHRGIVVDINPTAEEMLEGNLNGQLWRDIVQRCFSPRDDDGHEVSNHQGKRISITTRSLDKDGQIILLMDQTETRQLQANLSRHERLSALGKMVSTLAHQVRTPLSSAMLYGNLLLNENLPEHQQQQFTQKLVNRLHEMERQVRDMLLFVKGDVPLTDTIRIAELKEQLLETMEAPLQQHKTQCQWHISETSDVLNCYLRCNKDALIGALLNLINNSLQAMPQGGLITIEIQQAIKNSLIVRITDNGSGISDDIQEKVEEMFYTTKAQGTGIGLSVVNAVIKSHGGKFSLNSAKSGGTCATLVLPIILPTALPAFSDSATNGCVPVPISPPVSVSKTAILKRV